MVAEPAGVDYRLDPLSHRVIGAAVEVLRRLGPGFREDLYQNALCIQFEKWGIQYARQVEVTVRYEGRPVGTHLLDLLVEDALVVELKATSGIVEAHQAQLLAYLRAADARVGLLLNFGQIPLGIKRLVNRYEG